MIILVLLAVAGQDLKSRSVYLVLFPVLAILFALDRIAGPAAGSGLWQMILINWGFLAVQFLLLTAFFSIKKKKLSLAVTMPGWGDILFLVCCAVYFSVLNFVLFYLGSLVFSILVWAMVRSSKYEDKNRVPLAGLQAIFLVAVLTYCWVFKGLEPINDDWLLHLITWNL